MIADPLEISLLTLRIKDIIYSIDTVANYLNSDVPELRDDANMILSNLKESIPKFQQNYETHEGLRRICPDYVPVDFLSYLTIIEKACNNKEDVEPILNEMKRLTIC